MAIYNFLKNLLSQNAAHITFHINTSFAQFGSQNLFFYRPNYNTAILLPPHPYPATARQYKRANFTVNMLHCVICREPKCESLNKLS